MAIFYRIYKVNPSDSFTTIDTYDDIAFVRKNSYDISSALISSTINTANISIQITNLSRPEVVNVLYTSILDGTGTPYASFAACLTALNGLFSASGGGGGGGDATAANQTTQINAANALNTNIGATNDPLSGTPATVASLISIMKGFWSALVTKLSDKSQNTQIVDSGLIDGVKVVGNALQVAQQGDINIANFPDAVVLAFGADALQQSDPDVNGNYQTIEYFTGGLAGTLIKTISLTFDANGEVLTYEQI